ncbi:glycosyl hydrolase [Desertivirga xinjiangensis]|uniref:glycosyl hydrolase n=1 Tax=Desertivirga xinjiangensis TaxID=539206 RepID=UPI0021091B29|nr:glycosyl hydrolase [Pedobacter xinjiangensis]
MQRREFFKGSLIVSAGVMLSAKRSNAGWFTSGKSGVEHLDEIERNFVTPPGEARPWVFWQWMNGNITKEGITLDLEAMARMGIGGAISFNNATGIPKGPVDYASSEWVDLVEHAAKETERLGLKLVLHNGPGYSVTGGPWVSPEMSMQQLVWTETRLHSKGKKITISLPKPYAKEHYYRDAFVIAYPSLPVEKHLMKDALKAIRANDELIDINIITDRNPETKIRLEKTDQSPSTLVFEFKQAFEARAVSLLRKAEIPKDLFDGPRDYPPVFKIEVSNDGINYQQIATLNCPALREMDAPAAQSFNAIKAKFFRLSTFNPTWVSHVEFHSGPRISQWPAKTNYSATAGAEQTTTLTDDLIIRPENVIDISAYVNKEGVLSWKAPKGNWTILRIGHTTTGEEPAAHPDSGKGLEIDKFNREALDLHFDKFLGKVVDRLKPYSSFSGVATDSWEAGKQNWTAKLPEEFKQGRKYDILNWMPALTGRIVKSLEETERFLWDFRRTHADLLAKNYTAYYAERMHEKGLQYYAEPYGDGTFDSLEIGQHLDVPMSEFWTRYIYGSDMTSKQAASLAHVYGKPVVAAEAFTGMPLTSKWGEYPYSLKAEGDWFFTLGINRLTLHTFVHQPYTTGFPGMTMGPFGTHFDRNNTWTEQAHGWLKYTTRAQYVLQQGLSVIDVCYYKGDNPASGIPDVYPQMPKGYKADVIGSDALNRFNIKENKIVLPDGMQYRLLILPALNEILPTTLKRINELVEDGMILMVENKIRRSFGRTFTDEEVIEQSEKLLGNLDGVNVKERQLGKGIIYQGIDIKEILQRHKIPEDFSFTANNQDATIHYCHKIIAHSDVYFVSNHKRKKEETLLSFRTINKQPYIWDAETGKQTRINFYNQQNGRTTIPFEFQPASSVFIVFKDELAERKIVSILKDNKEIKSLKAYEVSDIQKYQSVINNFTLTFWAKPDTFAHSNKSMVFHAPEGEKVFGKGHTAVAMSIGQNIVRVYERSSGGNKEVLVFETAIQGYTHFALVYKNAVPYLYINGTLVKQGRKSEFIVHPGIETPPKDEQFTSYFEGNLSPIQLVDAVRDASAINEDYKEGLPAVNLIADIQILDHQRALFSSNGKYTINYTNEKPKHIVISKAKFIAISDAWAVTFPPDSGVKKEIKLPQLKSLHLHDNFDVKHFSGTCVYTRDIQIDKAVLSPDLRVLLDLGRVEVIASIKVNGKLVQLLWKEPFVADLTECLKSGSNSLSVEVTTLWPNRLVGDEHLAAENTYSEHRFILRLPDWYVNNKPKPGERKAFSVWKNFSKTDPLLASGLLGPAKLIIAELKDI